MWVPIANVHRAHSMALCVPRESLFFLPSGYAVPFVPLYEPLAVSASKALLHVLPRDTRIRVKPSSLVLIPLLVIVLVALA